MTDATSPGLTATEFQELAAAALPLAVAMKVEVVSLGGGRCRLRLPHSAFITRPGATVAGPPMMAVADMAMYGAILSLDRDATGAVTNSFTMHFLRPARDADVIAEGTVVRLGRRLAYVEVSLIRDDDGAQIGHAVGTYARPDAAPNEVGS
jgi:uncharacterized protein (TIGR00369 family)